MDSKTVFWLAAALAAGWLFSGCGTSAAGPASKAARVARSTQERIAGAWQGTMLIDDETVAGKLTDQQLAELQALEMGMEFRSDGTLLLTGIVGDKPYTSRNQWELVRDGGKEITIKSIEPSGQEKEIVLVFEGDDVFLLPMKTEVAELGAMRFERLR
ncbi:MAG TPA: hypothetical protein VFB96_02800 [Pirellulaceae bacterium]|nr:hypothetical protein [Pirellulaceae bacterium]